MGALKAPEGEPAGLGELGRVQPVGGSAMGRRGPENRQRRLPKAGILSKFLFTIN